MTKKFFKKYTFSKKKPKKKTIINSSNEKFEKTKQTYEASYIFGNMNRDLTKIIRGKLKKKK